MKPTKRYYVCMDDGEYRMSGTLEECREYRNENDRDYINRWHVLYCDDLVNHTTYKCDWGTGEKADY